MLVIHMTEDDLRRIIREEAAALSSQPEKNDNPEPPKYLTRDEVSALLHISKVSLNKYKKLKILVPRKIGGRVLYSYESIMEALNGNLFNKG